MGTWEQRIDFEDAARVMTSMRQMDWAALWLGWTRHWISKPCVIDFAVSWLHSNPSDDRLPVVLLAGAERCDDDEIRQLLAQIIDRRAVDEDQVSERWRLTCLVALAEQDLSWHCKVDRLEDIRAEFGYPIDMTRCSRYGPSEWAIEKGFASTDDIVDPVDEMHRVIAKLKARQQAR